MLQFVFRRLTLLLLLAGFALIARAQTPGRLIESADLVPAREQWLQPGDRLQLRVKAQPGAQVTVFQNMVLPEQAPALANGQRGIYLLNYVVQPFDTLYGQALLVRARLPNGRRDSMLTLNSVRIMPAGVTQLARTRGALSYLNYGLGEDRLGGAKIGYLDSLVLLHITGRVGDQYRVRLADRQTAWVPLETVRLLPPGGFGPQSLTGSWSVSGDEQYDYVRVPLQERLPYRSQLQLEPTRLVVDVFGATSNTNWITQRAGLQEIENVYYEQPQPDVFRIVIDLKHAQSWGYAIGYVNNVLTIRVRRPPQKLELKGLTVAVDAGHGGDNHGATGATGVKEKDLTLAMAQKLRAELEKKGVNVLMTRESDISLENGTRVLRLRQAMPHLLVSIHVNSAGGKETNGTATFYRYVAFRPLAKAVYEEMTKTGLKPWGNVGAFNFALSGPTEFPNVLVETAFVSNPDDERRLIDPAFQQQIAERISEGLEEFLKTTRAKGLRGWLKKKPAEQ